MSWLAVGIGAVLGSWARWWLQAWLGAIHVHVQIGTLACNLIGGYLIGLALAFFSANPGLPPEWRLFVITGFLGGLTTFSAFSGESMTLIQRGHIGWALIHTGLHLFGALLAAFAGFATYRAFTSS